MNIPRLRPDPQMAGYVGTAGIDDAANFRYEAP
jgi:hypothetical protein